MILPVILFELYAQILGMCFSTCTLDMHACALLDDVVSIYLGTIFMFLGGLEAFKPLKYCALQVG